MKPGEAIVDHDVEGLDCWCRPTPMGDNVYVHKTWETFLEYVSQLEEAYGKVGIEKALHRINE